MIPYLIAQLLIALMLVLDFTSEAPAYVALIDFTFFLVNFYFLMTSIDELEDNDND
jgi:hypothetical protein